MYHYTTLECLDLYVRHAVSDSKITQTKQPIHYYYKDTLTNTVPSLLSPLYLSLSMITLPSLTHSLYMRNGMTAVLFRG